MAKASPTRRQIVKLILWCLVVASLVAGGIGLSAWQNSQESVRSIAGQATLTASSTDPLFSPRAAVNTGSADLPGAGWVSDNQTSGAWIELQWPKPESLGEVILVRNSLNEPGVTSGYITFGDGSHLFVMLSTTSRQTAIRVNPRNVDSLRFTAFQVSGNATNVTVSEIIVTTTNSGDAVGDPTPDGNSARAASVSSSDPAPSSDPLPLTDGTGLQGGDGLGAAWTLPKSSTPWVQLTWDEPRELSSVQVVGAADSRTTIQRATLWFSDGSKLPIGKVLADPSHPTTLSFMPRMTTSVRLQVDGTVGTGDLRLAEIRTYRSGATPNRPTAAATSAAADPGIVSETRCIDDVQPTRVGLVVRCPVMGSTVDHDVTFSLSASPVYRVVRGTIWSNDADAPEGPAVETTLDQSGLANLTLPASDMPRGPFTVHFQATGGSAASANVYFQLYRTPLDGGDPVASSGVTEGRTLVYSEEFNEPISLSRDGANADYSAAKPVVDGAVDFGDAIFADPEQYNNVRVVDGRYLRIDVAPLGIGEIDPQGWGRDHIGGLLASARPGGSGFSAQFGYFESRMLVPAAPGTWPAFWMLPTDNLISEQSVVAEIDAVELYGHEPKNTCSSTHQHEDTPDITGIAHCGQRFESERVALAWHTYGVAIMPDAITFYIDGAQVASAPQVKGGDSPMFFLIDLALGGGWPIDLSSTQERASMYVDYIRAYV